MTALSAKGLCKSFGSVEALKSLDITVPDGSFFGLLGPNGAGKSTFMSIVSGFIPADSGTVSLFGEPLDVQSTAQKLCIGLAPQNIALYKELSAQANLKLFGQLYGLKGSMLSKRIDEALDLAQLNDRRKSLVKEYSGGMMRRLNIAVALMHRPKLLLCDEPTVGVDPQSRNAIFDTLLELKNRGVTVIFSTHYMEEAERLCDQIGIIDQGRILRLGKLDDLLQELPAISAVLVNNTAISEQDLIGIEQFGSISSNHGSMILEPKQGFRLSNFYRWVEDQNLDVREFRVKGPTLENLFLQLTGRELRE